MNTEDELQEMLRRRAGRVQGDLPFEDVRARARSLKRRRQVAVVGAVAAAVVAVSIPSALLLRPSDEVSPAHHGAPTPAPSTPAPSQSTSSGPAKQVRTLGSVHHGADTGLTYLDSTGTVHSPDGAGTRLPGDLSQVLSFTAYHGGWIVVDGNGTLHQYDSSGHQVRTGRSSGVVVGPDGHQVAFQVDKSVRMGIATGMGNGAAHWTVPANSTMLGFLPDGPATTGGDDSITELTSGGTTHSIQLGMTPVTTSGATGLVGGVTGSVAKDDEEGAVVDSRTGEMLWHNQWRPLRFDPAGGYVAAAPVADNGDPSTIAILDSRTGRVVARTPAFGQKIHLDVDVVAWDGSRLEFNAWGPDGQALLALTPSGRLARASDVADVPASKTAFVFSAQP